MLRLSLSVAVFSVETKAKGEKPGEEGKQASRAKETEEKSSKRQEEANIAASGATHTSAHHPRALHWKNDINFNSKLRSIFDACARETRS